MKLLLTLVLSASVVAAGLTAARAANVGTAPDSSSVKLPAVSTTAATEDGRELFTLKLFEPWENAGRRVALLMASTVSDEALPTLSIARSTDDALGANEWSTRTEHHRVTVRLNAATWSEVKSDADLKLTVEPLE